MSCEGDMDDFDPCEHCEFDPETCGGDVCECAADMKEQYAEAMREATE